MSEERKFDEAAFDKAVAKPNGWSKVADPVAEIRKMRDGDEAFGKDVLRTALSLVRAHFDGSDDVFLEKSRELAARLDKEGRGDLASFVRAQTGDEPSCVPMERKPRAATGNAAAMRAALAKFLDLSRRGMAFFTSYRYTEAENDEIEAAFDEAKSALYAPPRNCDVGTAQEQIDRFNEFCHSNRYYIVEFHGDDCRPDCPIWTIVDRDNKFCDNCWAAWSQMPFAQAEGGAE